MAIISLRAYNREIEGMIDNGQLDEAVAHCRHILATFPKHIASYRLLGKAHLEQQRISDATDIFQRVLAAIPDDFLSNVGMSIIREDENNLDAAIWHMELAYEAQPANIAIQDELRRLYGRRDGTQPPKVRLTRGALARMYAKGGLYDQAIAELRSAITEDPNRPDLQLLLAQMLYQTSQRVEAVETCVTVLKKIPQCLEANRILAVSLPDAEGTDAVKNYRQIVISMDPYYAFAESDAISTDQVPENTVNIERLDWKSGLQVGETPNQPAWATSLGISMDKPAEENIPEWLKSAEAPPPGTPVETGAPNVSPFIWDTQEVEKIITDTSKTEGDIPDWMKDAGWKSSTGELSTPTEETKPGEPALSVPSSEDLEKTEIPDWLSGIAPEGALTEDKPGSEPNADDLSTPWLEPHQPGPTDSIIQWLDEKKPGTAASASNKEELSIGEGDEIPDWLRDIETPQSAVPTQEEPSAESTPAFSFESSAFAQDTTDSKPAGAEDTSLEDSIEPAVEIQPSEGQPIIPPEVSETKDATAAFSDEIPDWLKEIAEEIPEAGALVSAGEEPVVESTDITEPELAPEKLAVPEEERVIPGEELTEGLVETTEALTEAAPPQLTEEMPVNEGEPISEEAPATQLPVMEESLPEAEMTAIPSALPTAEAETISEEVPTLPQLTQEETATEAEMTAVSSELPMVEIESFSAGAPSTEQLTDESAQSQEGMEATKAVPEVEQTTDIEQLQPEAANIPSEEIPSIESTTAEAEQALAEQPVLAEGEVSSAEPTSEPESDALAWLEDLVAEQATKADNLATPVLDGEVTPPDWVKLENEPTLLDGENLKPELEKDISALPAQDIPEWIKGLGEEPEIEPTPETPVSSVTPEAEIPQAEELPAWLLEMEPPTPPIEGPASPEEPLEWKSEELPAWLMEITESAEPEARVIVDKEPSTQEILSAVEALPADQIPAGLSEATSEQVEPIVPPIETIGEAKEEPQEQIGAWIPEGEAIFQQVSETPSVAEPEPILFGEEMTPPAEENIPVPVPEPAQLPAEMESGAEIETLANARNAITQGQPSQAVAFYSELIKKNYRLNEVIKDLQDALYIFPVDVNMWVTLGDAHNRCADLQMALNAYTKAEELVR